MNVRLTGALALLACAILMVGCDSPPDRSPPPPSAPAAPAGPPRAPAGVLVHLFEWPWADVARECADVLGPAGIAGVQVSPPQEHVTLPGAGYPWWQDYQPVSYQIGSRRGDRAAFAEMVRQCHSSGVKIYADAVVNHMTARDAGVGSAGTAFTRYGYPGLYAETDFHPCRTAISDYADRADVQDCQLVGLADLDTSNAAVQAKIAGYLRDLLSLGVDGFRLDAAKHIDAADLRAIVSTLDPSAVVWSEVLYAPSEPIQATEYRDFGATLEPRYGETVSRAFRNSLSLLDDLGEQTGSTFTDLLPSAGSVIYVDSHDTQRGDRTLSYRDGVPYTLASQYMLAWPYGTPLLMSSFAFDSFDAGPPSDPTGRTLPVVCDGSAFICEHRNPAVLAMVKFRAAAGEAPADHWWATEDQLGFGRGAKGYFALNRARSPMTRTVETGLPAGSYTDLINGSNVQVDSAGKATITIPATGSVALVPA